MSESVSGREPLDEAVVVDAHPHAVDPADAQRLVDGLRPGQARAAGRLLVIADPQLRRGRVVSVEPVAERFR
jgi:hypothetical protein